MTSPAIPEAVQERIRKTAHNRCGYCLSPQQLVLGKLEIEHIIPRASGGRDNEDNLWLACRLCNSYKAAQTHAYDPLSTRQMPIFNPRQQSWKRHFRWSNDGIHIIGRTRIGRATVIALQLNNPIAATVRRNWVAAGWHPPD